MEASQLLAKVGDSMSAGRIFGQPIEREGVTLVPVALVLGGGGVGKEEGREAVGDKAARGPGEGGGFGMVCWPIGAYVIKGGDARFVPSFDIAQLVILGSAATAKIFKALRGGGRRRQRKLARG